MARTSDLTVATAADITVNDLIQIVDVEDTTTMNVVSGTNKKATIATFAQSLVNRGLVGLPIPNGTPGQYYSGDKTWATLDKTAVGLGNVTNESKATMFASPTFTGTVSGITATMVGLGNVTNESKATMFSSPVFTEVPTAPTASIGTSTGQLATTKFVYDVLNTSGGIITTSRIAVGAVTQDKIATSFVQRNIGNITYDGKIGTSANLPLITTANGSITVGSFGNTANQFCAGNDKRIDNLHTVVNNTASTYTITVDDNNKYIRCTNATGTALTLDGSGAWQVGMAVVVRRHTGAGDLTLSATNATINDSEIIQDIISGHTFLLKCVDTSNPTDIIFDFI